MADQHPKLGSVCGARRVQPRPTHVSLVTGVSPRAHGVVANHDASDLVRAPPLHGCAHAAGLRTVAQTLGLTMGSVEGVVLDLAPG